MSAVRQSIMINDGQDTAQGATTDAAGDPTVVGQLKRIAAGGIAGGALGAGEAHIGEVAGAGITITPSITVDTAAYAAKDNIGGKLTLTNAVRINGGVSILQSVMVIDRSNQNKALNIFLFDADLASTITDNAEPNLSSADIGKIVRRITILASDYVTVDHAGTDFGIAEITALAKVVKSAATTSLWMIITTPDAPDYVLATDLIVRLSFLYAN